MHIIRMQCSGSVHVEIFPELFGRVMAFSRQHLLWRANPSAGTAAARESIAGPSRHRGRRKLLSVSLPCPAMGLFTAVPNVDKPRNDA